MKKKLLLLPLPILVLFAFFIPVSRHFEVKIKATFFNTYQVISKADNWKKWRSDLRSSWLADSAKITSVSDQSGFSLKLNDLALQVNPVNGYSFSVNEQSDDQSKQYLYTLVPEKDQNYTIALADEKVSFYRYLVDLINGSAIKHTHLPDLERFMETPDLYYGIHIAKIHVTDTSIVVLTNTVLSKNKFSGAGAILHTLQEYLSKNQLQQTQPLIAQFLPGRNDSVHLKVGLPVGKKAQTKAPFIFMTMPGSGYFYTVNFKGKFNEREKAYAAVYRYFKDRNMQVPILPFETYLDNKLPQSDTDKINIRINFSTF